VTTLFWGAAATLQLVVLRWAGDVLGLDLSQAAALQALVGLGVIAGAAMAGRWLTLAHAPRLLPAALVLGLLVPALAWVDRMVLAVPALLLVGLLGGLLVVPLNALLQHRGQALLSAGQSVAVQQFSENLSVLALLGVYAGLTALHLPVPLLLALVGLWVAAGVVLLMGTRRPLRRAALRWVCGPRPPRRSGAGR
jgi:hypothetical protein